MSFDNNSFYDDNSTKNWQPQPTPMEDRRRRHTGRWITAIVILALLVLTGIGTVHLVRDVGVTLNRSDSGFLLTIGRDQSGERAAGQTAAPPPGAPAPPPRGGLRREGTTGRAMTLRVMKGSTPERTPRA